MGPTGSGKTELSLQLARRLNAEIISADSMQVYQGMDIGTAKPSQTARKRIPHHLIDSVSPRASFSVFQYRQRALQAIKKIIKKNRLALVIGGSGLYVETLWKGISDQPGADAGLRKQLQREAKRDGLGLLHQKLKNIDPARARVIHPNDAQRIIRALEIALPSGRKPSGDARRKGGLEELGYSVRFFGIHRDRSELYQRINQRVEQMFRKGFLQEVKRLKPRGFSKTAAQALGYKEILESFQNSSTPTRQDFVLLIQKRTRQFAKRQLTWFRREKAIEWIDWGPRASVRNVCDKIMALYGQR